MTKKCTGTGLIALDVILNGSPETPPKVSAGGSCGNVLTILSFLGWKSYPISRLSDKKTTTVLLNDLKRWHVDTSFIKKDSSGNTPIIIHRILRNKKGNPIHKFEFRNPSSGKWLPSYKAVTWKMVNEISANIPNSNVFYFDRINRGSIELARIARSQGALVVLEPSSIKNTKHFYECVDLVHILKFSSERIKEFKKNFINLPIPLIIETLGTYGLNYKFKTNDWNHIPAFEVDKIIDAAGAGDWSTAGIISILGQQGVKSFESSSTIEIEKALNYGQILGAINCLFDGARGIMYNMNSKTLIDVSDNFLENMSIKTKDIYIKDGIKPNTLKNTNELFNNL